MMKPHPLRRAKRTPEHAFIGALALALAGCGSANESSKPAPASGEFREFAGSWNAAGTRRSIPLGGERKGSIIDLRGTMLLAGDGRPAAGFRSDVIALVDSDTGMVGRSVWTDGNGDQVFSEISGEGTKEQNRISGTILGGTGRYDGTTGAYEFSWQFLIESEDGSLQGSAKGLKGRIRPGHASAGNSQ